MSGAAYAPAPQTEDAPSSSSSNPQGTQLTPDSDSESDLEVYGAGDGLAGSLELKKIRGDPEKLRAGTTAGRRRDAGADDDDAAGFTPEEEKAVVKKFDRRLVLFMALLYMLSFLDRSSELAVPGSRMLCDPQSHQCGTCR